MLKNKILKRLKKPFDNELGAGITDIAFLCVSGFLSVTVFSWMAFNVMHTVTEERLRTISYNLSDSIAETGKLTRPMQDEYFAKFNKLKSYTNDYEIIIYKYSYLSGGFNKQQVGKSINGAPIPDITFDKGDNVQIIFKSTKPSPLDNFENVFVGGSEFSGVTVESGGKID